MFFMKNVIVIVFNFLEYIPNFIFTWVNGRIDFKSIYFYFNDMVNYKDLKAFVGSSLYKIVFSFFLIYAYNLNNIGE